MSRQCSYGALIRWSSASTNWTNRPVANFMPMFLASESPLLGCLRYTISSATSVRLQMAGTSEPSSISIISRSSLLNDSTMMLSRHSLSMSASTLKAGMMKLTNGCFCMSYRLFSLFYMFFPLPISPPWQALEFRNISFVLPGASCVPQDDKRQSGYSARVRNIW